LVARLAATGVKALAVLSICVAGLLLAFGLVRFSALALAVALILAVALTTLALALPWGR
jgi:type IV secretory pathway VirB2 component (pilin)